MGMDLSPGDIVKATAYTPGSVVECQLIEFDGRLWVAKDIENRTDYHCYGDATIIMLTEDMIKKVKR